MTIRRRSGLKCKSLLLVGMLTMSSGGCVGGVGYDNPFAVWATGVGLGIMDGLISTTLVVLGEAFQNPIISDE